MQLQLTEIEHSKELSEETPAFSALLHINGVPRGRVRNSGRGGCCMWEDRDAEREIDAYALTLPAVDIGEGFMCPQSAETLVFCLLP